MLAMLNVKHVKKITPLLIRMWDYKALEEKMNEDF